MSQQKTGRREERIRLRLLIDSLTVRGGGMLQLQRELAWGAARTRSTGSEVILVVAEKSPTVEARDGLQVKGISARWGSWRERWRWYNRGLPALAVQERVDVVYSLSGIVSQSMTRNFAVVSTVNNMLPFTPRILEVYPLFSMQRIRLLMLKRLYLSAVRKADAIVLHSRHALETISRFAGSVVLADEIRRKTRVVLTGVPYKMAVDPSRPPPHPRGGIPYFFYLSRMHAYKNHLNLVEGYRRAFKKSTKEMPDLLMAGMPSETPYVRQVLRAIECSGLGRKITYQSFVDRNDIPTLLHHAQANFFPSLCETNPVVLAEILGAHGVMACSAIPPMDEISGGAAEVFDPLNPDSIADTMITLAQDEALRRTLRQKAGNRAKDLSWGKCGETIWEMAGRAWDSFRTRRSSGRKGETYSGS